MTGVWCLHWYVKTLSNGNSSSGISNTSQIFNIGTCILVLLASQIYGWDRHVWDELPSTLSQGRKVSQPLCNWCYCKLS
jgi:hypothetical protein